MNSHNFLTSAPDRYAQKLSVENVNSVAEHHLFFASEYYFKPKGLECIRREFKYQLNLLEFQESLVNFKYEPENSNFLITCAPGKSNAIWNIFHTILTGMVREECQKSSRLYKRDIVDSSNEDSSSDDEIERDEDFMLVSDKIKRMDMFEAQVQQTVPISTCISPLNNIHNQADSLDFNYIYDWDVKALEINDIFSESILQELSGLTGCIFNKDSNENRIYIRSSLVASLNSGISKMNNIKNYFLSQKNSVYHFFYTELETNVQFSFLRLSNSKNRIFKTTLIDNFVPKNKKDKKNELRDLIQNAVIMRCASFDRVSGTFRMKWKLKIVPVIKEEDRNHLKNGLNKPIFALRDLPGKTCELFNVNQSKTRDSIPTKKHIETAATKQKLMLNGKAPLISNWAKDVAKSGPIKAQVGNSELAGTKWKIPPIGPRSYEVHSSDRFKDVSQSIIHESMQNEITLRKLRSSLTSPTNMIGKISTPPKSCVKQETASDFWSRYHGRSSVNTKVTEHNQGQKNSYNSGNLITNKTRICNLMDECPPDLPCDILMPKKQQRISEIENRDILLIDFDEKKALPRSSFTLDESEINQNEEVLPHYSVSSSQQSISKSKRKKKQKKNSNPMRVELPLPTPKHKINESMVYDTPPLDWGNHILESFQQNLNSNFESMMKNIQGFRGELFVEAQFGRIITHGIKDMYISKKGECERTYNEESARKILNETDSNMVAPNFTKIMTTIPAEIQYIREIKDSHGIKCWLQEKKDLSSYYELYFQDMNDLQNNKFMIQINTENFDCRIKTVSELGILHVHGTTRIWDFRISATGINSEERLNIKHNELIEKISSSLFIPENCTLPFITFEKINETLKNRYHLDKAVNRYTHKYLSRDNQSILQISEVQSLKVEPRNSLDRNTIIRPFYPDTLNFKSSHLLRLWYEVSISSVRLDNELNKNKELELGELAEWSFEGMGLSSIAYSIYSPACWLLERLDGVGSFNDNGLDIQESSLVISDTKPAASQFYW